MIENNIKVLLVEDNESDVILIKRQLAKVAANVLVNVAIELEEIEDQINTFSPDLIFCDYNLPQCTGMEVLELVRSISESTTFVFITGLIHDEELAAETILSGASGYILKKHMPILHKKLLPFLKAVDKNTAIRITARQRIEESKKTIALIRDFLKNSFDDNEQQRESIRRIKEDLNNLTTDHDTKDF